MIANLHSGFDYPVISRGKSYITPMDNIPLSCEISICWIKKILLWLHRKNSSIFLYFLLYFFSLSSKWNLVLCFLQPLNLFSKKRYIVYLILYRRETCLLNASPLELEDWMHFPTQIKKKKKKRNNQCSFSSKSKGISNFSEFLPKSIINKSFVYQNFYSHLNPGLPPHPFFITIFSQHNSLSCWMEQSQSAMGFTNESNSLALCQCACICTFSLQILIHGNS